jgi:hypothetical protein
MQMLRLINIRTESGSNGNSHESVGGEEPREASRDLVSEGKVWTEVSNAKINKKQSYSSGIFTVPCRGKIDKKESKL